MRSRILVSAFAFALAVGPVLGFLWRTTSLYQVPSASMMSTIAPGDVVWVHQRAYADDAPKTGDIAVFRSPETGSVEYIKRVVAEPGDTIEVQQHRLFKRRELVVETYARLTSDAEPVLNRPSAPLQRIPPEHFYAMGDNRPQSADSRIYGPVPFALLRGRAFAVVWPPNHWRWLRGAD